LKKLKVSRSQQAPKPLRSIAQRDAHAKVGGSIQKELLVEGIGPDAFDLEEWQW
jgi:hypothetical protein